MLCLSYVKIEFAPFYNYFALAMYQTDWTVSIVSQLFLVFIKTYTKIAEQLSSSQHCNTFFETHLVDRVSPKLNPKTKKFSQKKKNLTTESTITFFVSLYDPLSRK